MTTAHHVVRLPAPERLPDPTAEPDDVMIHRAVGVIMTALGTDSGIALDVLSGAARHCATTPVVVAERFVSAASRHGLGTGWRANLTILLGGCAETTTADAADRGPR